MIADTPKSRRIMAKRFARETGERELVEYKKLRCGDIFEAIGPDGRPVDPITLEPIVGPPVFARAEEDAAENDLLGEGYCMPIMVGPLKSLLGKSLN